MTNGIIVNRNKVGYAANAFENLSNIVTEEVRSYLLDKAELRNFLKECKDADISIENKRSKEAFESLKKTFPNLRLQGSWVKGRNKYFLGNAPVVLTSYSTGPEASFAEGPAQGCGFSTLEGLGNLLRCYKDLDLHILGEDK